MSYTTHILRARSSQATVKSFTSFGWRSPLQSLFFSTKPDSTFLPEKTEFEKRLEDKTQEQVASLDGKRLNIETEGKEDLDNFNKATNEYGGPAGPEPTRYQDWEVNGRCTDF